MITLKNKKGFSAITGLIWTVVMAGLFLAIGLLILGKFQTKMTVDSAEANATGDIIKELSDAPTYIGIILIVGLLAVVIAYLSGWMGGGKTGRA